MIIQPQRSTILVFAKAPVPGTVKSRLVPLLGEGKAAELQAAMITNTVAVVTSRHKNYNIQLWCAPDTNHPLFLQLQRSYSLSMRAQQGQDLGQRMYQAFVHALKECDNAVVIGTDCPGISEDLLDQAFQALNSGNDAVIAPAEDGGYVLLGLKKAAVEIFSGIDWGTNQVYHQTIAVLEHLQLQWESLHTQWDVDRPQDFIRLVKEKGRQWHPRLQSVLDSVKSFAC